MAYYISYDTKYDTKLSVETYCNPYIHIFDMHEIMYIEHERIFSNIVL